jgi:hypothetical protein
VTRAACLRAPVGRPLDASLPAALGSQGALRSFRERCRLQATCASSRAACEGPRAARRPAAPQADAPQLPADAAAASAPGEGCAAADDEPAAAPPAAAPLTKPNSPASPQLLAQEAARAEPAPPAAGERAGEQSAPAPEGPPAAHPAASGARPEPAARGAAVEHSAAEAGLAADADQPGGDATVPAADGPAAPAAAPPCGAASAAAPAPAATEPLAGEEARAHAHAERQHGDRAQPAVLPGSDAAAAPAPAADAAADLAAAATRQQPPLEFEIPVSTAVELITAFGGSWDEGALADMLRAPGAPGAPALPALPGGGDGCSAAAPHSPGADAQVRGLPRWRLPPACAGRAWLRGIVRRRGARSQVQACSPWLCIPTARLVHAGGLAGVHSSVGQPAGNTQEGARSQ